MGVVVALAAGLAAGAAAGFILSGALGRRLDALRDDHARLLRALTVPAVRGRWGELQLRRVLEIAGMLEHCDFDEQPHADGLRPDVVVHLPGGRHVVIDAKAPLQACLDAIETTDDAARADLLRAHARHVRAHAAALASKAYWRAFDPSPEFVVLFLPGEPFFAAAVEHDPDLLANDRVILASPTTLIALLRAVHAGWREQRAAENAERIRAAGTELHERVSTMLDHATRLGVALSKSVEAYNATVASAEQRVLPSARRLEEMGAGRRPPPHSPGLISTSPNRPTQLHPPPSPTA